MLTHEPKIAHLGFIQNVINRMGNNSFLLKGWSVALLAASFTLAVDNAERRILLISPIFLLTLWLLDAYFLRQENLYRRLYDARARGTLKRRQRALHQKLLQAGETPSRAADVLHFYSMDTRLVEDIVCSYWQLAFSRTLLGFHLSLALMAVGLISIIFFLGPSTKSDSVANKPALPNTTIAPAPKPATKPVTKSPA